MLRSYRKITHVHAIVRAMCSMRRPWKYDETVLEYFIETADSVKIKKKDLECHRRQKKVDLEANESVLSLQDKSLVDPAAMRKAQEEATNGGGHLTKASGLGEIKENLTKFTDALHAKASTVTNWIINLEPPALPEPTKRAQELLG